MTEDNKEPQKEVIPLMAVSSSAGSLRASYGPDVNMFELYGFLLLLVKDIEGELKEGFGYLDEDD